MIDAAFIFTAGKGTRLRPLTDNLPKPMVQVKGRPILEYTLEFMVAGGVRHFFFNTHYLASKLEEYLLSLKSRGVLPADATVTVLHEEQLLETGGAIYAALARFSDPELLVANSDYVYQCGDAPQEVLNKLEANFDPKIMDALLLSMENNVNVGFGEGDYALLPALPQGACPIYWGQEGERKALDKPWDYVGMQLISLAAVKATGDQLPKPAFFSTRDVWLANLREGVLTRTYAMPQSGRTLQLTSADLLAEIEKLL